MTQEQQHIVNGAVVIHAKSHHKETLALGWLRFWMVEKLTVSKFAELKEKSIATGKEFNELIDELISKELK